MKKKLAVLLCAVLLFAAFAPVTALADGENQLGFFISIYHDVEDRYIVENVRLETDSSLTILETIELLKSEGYISDYTLYGRQLDSVSWEEEGANYTVSIRGNHTYFVKRNGETLSGGQLASKVVQDDIIEWLYAEMDVYSRIDTSSAASTSSVVSTPAEHWSDTAAAAVNRACGWLQENQEDSTLYPVSMGCAGKNIDVEVVNNLLAEVSREPTYESATDIAKRILLLSFCGFDAGNAALSSLLSQLMEYDSIMGKGIFGAVNTLVAYDSRSYSVPNGVKNNRQTLVESILEMQREDGSFPIYSTSKSDIDTTAMVASALSGYTDNTKVKNAVEKAIAFLAENQTENGGFGYQGGENCESLAQVIIALSSNGISLSDERFVKGEKNLVDALLEYQTADGGFSHTLGGESAVMPTEQAIIALSAVRKGGNPYFVTGSVQNTIAVSPQVPPQEVQNEAALYLYIGVGLVVLLLATILVGVVLRRSPKQDKESEN